MIIKCHYNALHADSVHIIGVTVPPHTDVEYTIKMIKVTTGAAEDDIYNTILPSGRENISVMAVRIFCRFKSNSLTIKPYNVHYVLWNFSIFLNLLMFFPFVVHCNALSSTIR